MGFAEHVDEGGGPVIGVIGGSGGVGASSFAGALAVLAGSAVLVDLDVCGGGIDVVLGIEEAPGARWSELRLAGGRLDAAVLLDGLPRAGPCAVLAADTATLDPAAVLQVLDAASSVGPVIVDLPRAFCAERAAALLRCDLVVIVTRGDVAGVVSAHAVASALPELPAGVVVRQGEVSGPAVAEVVGAPLLGTLPELRPGRFALDPARLPRRTKLVAAGVLAGVAA
jgi:secretion/DNA translocation related CpaE-like protein